MRLKAVYVLNDNNNNMNKQNCVEHKAVGVL